MTEWFAGCKTVAAAKARYRALAMAHHPDRGGDTATMQAINAAYHRVLASLDGEVTMGVDDREHTYRYDREVEQAVMDKIGQLLALRMTGVDIDLIGVWVWATGNTKTYREQLKAVGMWWHSKRVAWYWHGPSQYSHYNAHVDLDDLAQIYGVRRFANESAAPLARKEA